MTKFSQLAPDTTPTITDEVATRDVESGSNKRVTVQDLITLFFNNIPANTPTATSLAADVIFDHIVANSGVITADAAGTNRNASMSAITAYISGQRGTIAAVVARTYTANKDTYVDILNTAGTFTLVYTEVSNNAASPTLAANSIRLGIVVTGATTIATAASINQGQQDRVLPIASSIAYSVTDSIGNLICPRDPHRRVLGYRQITSNITTTSATPVQMTGLTCPVIVPAGRKARVKLYSSNPTTSAGGAYVDLTIWDGTVSSGTLLQQAIITVDPANCFVSMSPEAVTTPTSTSKTYNAGFQTNGGTLTNATSATTPTFIVVELS